MSFQKFRHKKRNEIWLSVSKGACEVLYSKNNPDSKNKTILNKFDKFMISKGFEWHQITNPFKKIAILLKFSMEMQ